MRLAGEQQSRRKANGPVAPADPARRVAFEYAGLSGLTVMGPVSGERYRFERPGSVVQVDARDRILLGSIRQLRQVRESAKTA